MKANKDPKIEIKDIDANCYHVELTRITGTAVNPEIAIDIQCYTKKDFHLFQTDVEKNGIGITGYTSARVVHNPNDPKVKEPVMVDPVNKDEKKKNDKNLKAQAATQGTSKEGAKKKADAPVKAAQAAQDQEDADDKEIIKHQKETNKEPEAK